MTEFQLFGTDLSVQNDLLKAINHLQWDQNKLRPSQSFILRNKQSQSCNVASIDFLSMSLTSMSVTSQGPNRHPFVRNAVKELGWISPILFVSNAPNGSVINVHVTMFVRFRVKQSIRWFAVTFAWNAKNANVAAAIVSGLKARSMTSTMFVLDVWSKQSTYVILQLGTM